MQPEGAVTRLLDWLLPRRDTARHNMKRLIFLLVLFTLPGTFPPSAEARQPNILFIFLDDFGWKDTSYMGSDFFETPHLDQLAEGGMIFTDAYSCAANCAPARACLLSGQYTPRHEIYNVGTRPRGKEKDRKLEHIPGVDALRSDITTWASCLQKTGYRTASMGKWHLGNDPRSHGFDVNVGGSRSGGPPKGYYPPHGKAPGLQNVPENEYLTDTLSHRACEFISENKDRPWLLYLTHFAVHTPLDAKKELLPKYEKKPPGKQHKHVKMATMIQAVDDGVGEIVARLDKLGLREDTVIFFFSDNGGYGPATDMAPLKGYKGTYYEGGIRVPFFVNWPGKIKAGRRCDLPVIGVDLFPTFCEIGGAELPGEQILDGKSLVALLTNPESAGQGKKAANQFRERAVFWHFPAYLQSYSRTDQQRDPLFRSRPCSLVRKGDWKLHEYFEDNGFELYNLRVDIGETRNLADSNPAKLAELKEILSGWRKKIDAPVPQPKH